MKRKPGYYCEGRHYGFSIAQAQARAQHLAREYGRPVAVTYVDIRGAESIVETHGEVRHHA